jgi:hypothetical protein
MPKVYVIVVSFCFELLRKRNVITYRKKGPNPFDPVGDIAGFP